MKHAIILCYVLFIILLLSGCSSSEEDDTTGIEDPSENPASSADSNDINTLPDDGSISQDYQTLVLGNWIQVNFLATDDNGVWGDDDLTGIGFFSMITESEWIDSEDGCPVTFSYSIDNDGRFKKTATSVGAGCPFGSSVLAILSESGTLEFTNSGTYMNLYFDLQPGDDIAAFRFLRQ